MKITDQVWEFAEPLVQACGCSLWDVEYVREGGEWFLRLYLDKEGGVDIDDCEAVSRAVDPVLDEKDPIPESYRFEVCSAGLERQLKRPSDFERYLGEPVLVKLYRPRDGQKEFPGRLVRYEDGAVTIEVPMHVLCTSKDTPYTAGMLAVLVLLCRMQRGRCSRRGEAEVAVAHADVVSSTASAAWSKAVADAEIPKAGHFPLSTASLPALAFALLVMAVFRSNGVIVLVLFLPILFFLVQKSSRKKAVLLASRPQLVRILKEISLIDTAS